MHAESDRRLTSSCRVKLPKSFLAINLSDAFTFQEAQNGDNDVLEMKALEHIASSSLVTGPKPDLAAVPGTAEDDAPVTG